MKYRSFGKLIGFHESGQAQELISQMRGTASDEQWSLGDRENRTVRCYVVMDALCCPPLLPKTEIRNPIDDTFHGNTPFATLRDLKQHGRSIPAT